MQEGLHGLLDIRIMCLSEISVHDGLVVWSFTGENYQVSMRVHVNVWVVLTAKRCRLQGCNNGGTILSWWSGVSWGEPHKKLKRGVALGSVRAGSHGWEYGG